MAQNDAAKPVAAGLEAAAPGPKDQASQPARPGRRLTLARRHRLHTQAHYRHVFDQSRAVSGRRCVLRAAVAPDGTLRIGIVVSKRYSKLAVVRNRARRLLREACRLLSPGFRPAWVVLLPRQGLLGATVHEALPEVRRLAEAAGLLTPAPPAPTGEGKAEG